MAKNIKVIIFILISLFLVISTVFYFGRTVYFEIRDGNNYQEEKRLGGDRDEHGCIGSAGYSWCEKKNKCLRLWEESCDGSTLNESPIPPLGVTKCGIENCHGLEIKCGSNPVEMCTTIYALGDKCRQYAVCEIFDGECRQTKDDRFDLCKRCVEDCINKHGADSSMKIFECENNCK